MTIAHNLKDPSLALVAQLEIYHADDDLASAASVVSLDVHRAVEILRSIVTVPVSAS